MSAEALEIAYKYVFMGALAIMAVFILISLLRAVFTKKVADKLISINMIGTIVIMAVATLSVFLKEDYVADICLIWATLSFTAVVVLTKIYIGQYEEKHEKKEEEKHHGND